jgi:hypothetical protein
VFVPLFLPPFWFVRVSVCLFLLFLSLLDYLFLSHDRFFVTTARRILALRVEAKIGAELQVGCISITRELTKGGPKVWDLDRQLLTPRREHSSKLLHAEYGL